METSLFMDRMLSKGGVSKGDVQNPVYVAQNRVSTLDSMNKKVRSLVQGYTNLDTAQKDKLISLLEDNVDLFSKDPNYVPQRHN